MSDTELAPPQRRKFLVGLLGALGAFSVALFGYPLWSFLRPLESADEASRVSIPREQVPLDQAHFFNYQGRPAVILQTAPGDFAAFSAVCTHLGCIVQWEPAARQFLCPCHGGRFSARGDVVAGPPPQPLQSLPVTLDGATLVVG